MRMIVRQMLFGLITGAFAASAALGSTHGEILPLRARGLKIIQTSRGPVAHYEHGDVALDVKLTTNREFVFVELKLANMGAKVLDLGSDTVTLLSEGTDEVEPVTPEQYGEMAFDVTLSDSDLSDTSSTESDDARESASKDKRHHHARPEVRDFSHTGRSVAEAMSDPTADDSKDQERHRKEAIAAVKKLRRDPVLNGGPVPPGTTVRGKMIYLRSHCDPPFVVKVRLGSRTASIRFARQ